MKNIFFNEPLTPNPSPTGRGGTGTHRKPRRLVYGFLSISLFLFALSFITPALAAVVIINEELTSVEDDSFVVTWTTTNEPAATAIEYGISGYTNTSTVSGTTNYHWCQATGLLPNTTYQYRVKSGSVYGPPRLVTTLRRPSGEYLFSFAVLSDPRYAEGRTPDSSGARGLPYSICGEIISSSVSDINALPNRPAFIVLGGNQVDVWTTNSGDQAKNEFKARFVSFTGASDLGNPNYRLSPVPGFYDKLADYTTGWITDNLNPLRGNTTQYTSADAGTDSVYNYSFSYKNYNFVFADSVTAAGAGHLNINAVRDLITAEARKTFIFSSYPAYDLAGVLIDGTTERDYPISLPTVEGAAAIDNSIDFRAALESLTYTVGSQSYPLTAAVVSGHIGDNYKRDIHGISYVRQGPAVQYPTGYSVYRVYSNGYTKTFYKTSGRDTAGKPYYEHARDLIADSDGLIKSLLTSFWLGSNSMRNFSYSYPYAPGIAPRLVTTTPTSGAFTVPLNQPFVVTFNKRMSSLVNSNWIYVTPTIIKGTPTMDASGRVITFPHSGLDAGKTYTVTLLKTEVRDEGGGGMDNDQSFYFYTTGSTNDYTPPAVSILNPPADNITTDILPTFLGIATDEAGVGRVDFRVDGGSWLAAEPVDGMFNSRQEIFSMASPDKLTKKEHLLEIRAYDSIGNAATSEFTSFAFIVADEKPRISLLIDGIVPLPGDPIGQLPQLTVKVVSINPITSGAVNIDGQKNSLTYVLNDSYYSASFIPGQELGNGVHTITIEAFDAIGQGVTYEITPLYVEADKDPAVLGTPLTYPNPFDPKTGNAAISYLLSRSTNITLTIHSLSGALLAKKVFLAGNTGGRAGYNEVAWDGRSDGGTELGNGIYIVIILADGKVLARGKITVYKR
ncbi:MAG: Ig-like domain-containing protein [Candidatus Margulisbacteria bacterium]|nr:Ig-like domain-containing protein [Candidatus Margulisiibacteriota bacterium]